MFEATPDVVRQGLKALPYKTAMFEATPDVVRQGLKALPYKTALFEATPDVGQGLQALPTYLERGSFTAAVNRTASPESNPSRSGPDRPVPNLR
jgi:hypothetical protein